ncbi:MAG: hypothetical protein HXX08_11810 [Chloroflexi bacterium]|uniref:Glycosyltransferase family 39 protein n=1 Tax=Candidatus Chlorohelix allophototropha TaxID=3003348 RepID=A0A8T7M3F8_9CHLR|nr:hypothetical protein [Chloroflexota bacterium]WJW65925.1 glycosyltransferase family 39 protein [Chloroflexota bacterium L227-S17]
MQTSRKNLEKPAVKAGLKLPVTASDWLVLALFLLLGGLLLAKIIFSFNIMWQIFNYPFQVDESEGMIVSEVGMMAKGVDIFAPPSREIFISAPYTPLYYWLNLPFLEIMPGSFKPGRLISFIATLGSALIIFRLVLLYGKTRTKPSFSGAIIAAASWGSLGLVAFWGGAVKPDITAVFFNLLAIWFAAKWDLGQRAFRFLGTDGWLYLSALMAAMSVQTKQTAFAAAAAVLCFALIKRPLSALKFLGLYLLLGFAPMWLMNLLSNGGFWWHIVTVHELPWSFSNYWKFASAFTLNYQIYLVVALFFATLYLVEILPRLLKRRNPFPTLAQNPATLLLGYAATTLLVTFSAGTYGGNHNHLLEFAAAMSIGVGLSLSRLREWWQSDTKQIYRWIYPLALLLLAVQALAMFVAEGRIKPADFPVLGSIAPTRASLTFLHDRFSDPEWLGLQYRVPQPDQINGYSRVVQFITNDTGALIYSDDVSLVMPTGKRIFTTDTFTQTHATFYGRWDESQLVQMVRERKFSIIVLRESIQKRVSEGGQLQDIYLSPALASAILENYDQTCPDRATIYEPKDKDKSKRCG